jgi:hypothetical protein
MVSSSLSFSRQTLSRSFIIRRIVHFHNFAPYNNNYNHAVVVSSMKSVAILPYVACLFDIRRLLCSQDNEQCCASASTQSSYDSSVGGRTNHSERHHQKALIRMNSFGNKMIMRIAGSMYQYHHQQQKQQLAHGSSRYFSSSSATEPAAMLESDLSFESDIDDRDELVTEQDEQAEEQHQTKLSDVSEL